MYITKRLSKMKKSFLQNLNLLPSFLPAFVVTN